MGCRLVPAGQDASHPRAPSETMLAPQEEWEIATPRERVMLGEPPPAGGVGGFVTQLPGEWVPGERRHDDFDSMKTHRSATVRPGHDAESLLSSATDSYSQSDAHVVRRAILV